MDTRKVNLQIKEYLSKGSLLACAAKEIDKLISEKGYMQSLATLATDQDSDYTHEKLMATLILKYIVNEHWSSPKLRPNEKNALRQILLEKTVGVEKKLGIHLGIALGALGAQEFLKERSDSTVLEGILDLLENESEGDGLDGLLEALYLLLRDSDQKYTPFASKILAALFSAFINAEGKEDRQSKCLFLVYLTLRTFAWADGCNNDLVSRCLKDTFDSWRALIVYCRNYNI